MDFWIELLMGQNVPPMNKGSPRCEVLIRPHTICDRSPIRYVGPAATMNVFYSWLSNEKMLKWGKNEVLG